MIPTSTTYQDALQQITNYFSAQGSSLAQAHSQAIQWIGQQVQAQASLLATFRRKIREAECWGRIGAFAIFCKPGRI